MYVKTCTKCRRFKNRKSLYGQLPPKVIAALKPWNLVHIDLIGPYPKSIRQQHTGGTIIKKDVRLTYMTMIDPATGWFDIFKVPCFDLNEVARGNSEYIEKFPARVSQLLNQTWLCRYPLPLEVVFDNGSGFNKYFNPLLKDFSITPICTSRKKTELCPAGASTRGDLQHFCCQRHW